MHKIVITLEEGDLLELQAVLLDADEPAALAFLEKRIAARIPVKGTAACDSSRLNPYLWKRKTARPDGGLGAEG
ncbi:MAG: hypothetical protein HQ582_16900 [Planctomycetes bacterium]|nr:hypothetical protein [Planctomycetota bacterium]